MEEDDKWLDKNCWKNKSKLYRYFAMLMICTLGFGLFMVYDSVGALQEPIMLHLDLNAHQFSYLYSVGSWSASLLCFAGGYLIDKVFGIKLGTFIYALIASIGHFTFSFGILLQTFWSALLGRFIFGIGLEFMYISIQYYSVIYFKGKELSLMVSLALAISRLGSSTMFEIASPLLEFVKSYENGSKDLGIVLFIVGGFTLATVTSSLILSSMNPARSDKKKQASDKIKLSDVLKFDITYWLVVLAAVCNAMNIYVFMPFSQAFFMTQFGLTMEEANGFASFTSMFGASSAPAVGMLVDKVGREIFVMGLGFLFGLSAHLILAFTTFTPYLSMILLALSFCLLSASLTLVFSYIIPEKMLATAYGINQGAVNLTYSGIIVVAGVIVDYYGYQALELYIIAIVLVGLFSVFLLWIIDCMRQGNLNMSATSRREHLKKQLSDKEVIEPLNLEHQSAVKANYEE